MARVEVLVIGGGVTGAGIARDLALRGVEVLLLERGDFCSGASGANHGMLHSGARYAVTDPISAKECAEENKILKRVASFCIEECGGIFVSLPADDQRFASAFEKACRVTNVPCEHLTPQETKAKAPWISNDIVAAYAVEDASIDPFSLTLSNLDSARQAGAETLNYKIVTSMRVKGQSVEEIIFRDAFTGESSRVKPELVVNAAGPWAGEVAAMVGLELRLGADKGSMVVLDGRLTNSIVNRLRPPSDGDILVPNHSSTIIGTTSIPLEHPMSVSATRAEVQLLIKEASLMIPKVSEARAIRAYSGIRPLLYPSGRKSERGYRIIDHSEKGVENMMSVVGGKLTTYRLMAERVSDLVCRAIGKRSSCHTRTEPICSDEGEPHLEGVLEIYRRRLLRKYGPSGKKVGEFCLKRPQGIEVACSCEQVLQGELEYFASHPDVRTLSDLMRRTRAGMGYCQGGMCALRMVSALARRMEQDPKMLLEDFLSERWKGLFPVLEGEQLRQEVMKRYLLTGTYHLIVREGTA
ncbi:MAG: anaerobic glycerol-3-phosphate dehydrogenase subunit GlpA [Methanomassiliicoccales archaeon]